MKWMNLRKVNTWPIKLLIIAAVIVIAGVTWLAVKGLSNQQNQDKAQSTSEVTNNQKQDDKAKETTLNSHILFVGDIFWGRAVERRAVSSGLGPAHIFSGLKSSDREAYDAWIGNMECPVTDKNIAYEIQVESLIFNCRPEYAVEAAKWFDVFSLANNHTSNNGGEWGLLETRKNLEKSGIQYFGHYDMGVTDDICEVATVKARDDNNEPLLLPIALCGFHYVGGIQPKAEHMEQMARYGKVMPVIAMPHMGVEYRSTAEEAKIETFRNLIDNGADLVIGAHPHVVQNSETYRGKLIAYSVGNFLFDQQILGLDTTLSLGIGLNVKITDINSINKYQDVAAKCITYKDNCLELLEADLNARPKMEVSYDFQCFDSASNVPVRASKAVCDNIKSRATIDQLTEFAASW